MYTDDNDGSFMEGNLSGGTPRRTWIYRLQPYYKDGKLKLCPMATKPWGGMGSMAGDTSSPFMAFGPIWDFPSTENPIIGHYFIFEIDANPPWTSPELSAGDPWPNDFSITEEENYVSYAQNDWVRNDPRPGRRTSPLWRTSAVKGAGNVPLMVDAKQHYVVMPRNSPVGDAPQYKGEPGGWANPMGTICIDRHNGAINGVFLDWSSRRIGLKEIWKLKWSTVYPTDDGPVEGEEWPSGWSDWMKKLKKFE